VRLLILGTGAKLLVPYLDQHQSFRSESAIQESDVIDLRPDFLVSFGYRHLVRPEVLEAIEGRAINLHISLLPWNRGADPNLWSWLEDTPKGVSIHWMTTGLDRGDIVCQRPVQLDPAHTLRETYDSLINEVVGLFADIAEQLGRDVLDRTPQNAGGTYHRSADKVQHMSHFPNGWDTPCYEIRDYGEESGLSFRPLD